MFQIFANSFACLKQYIYQFGESSSVCETYVNMLYFASHYDLTRTPGTGGPGMLGQGKCRHKWQVASLICPLRLGSISRKMAPGCIVKALMQTPYVVGFIKPFQGVSGRNHRGLEPWDTPIRFAVIVETPPQPFGKRFVRPTAPTVHAVMLDPGTWSTSEKASEANWLTWSVVKISGVP